MDDDIMWQSLGMEDDMDEDVGDYMDDDVNDDVEMMRMMS